VQDEALFLSDHTCCICRTRFKDVQIHHIDGDPSNNDLGNLTVVCLDCHSRLTGRRGLGRAYTCGEVRRYKRNWEACVRATSGAHQSVAGQRQKELVSQEDLSVCEILACEKDAVRAAQLLDVLYELNLWRGSRRITGSVVGGLHHLAMMTGLGSPRLSGKVAETLWKVCWHFVGPDRVSMGKNGLALVLECVDALGTLAEFNCMIGHGQTAATIVAEQLENFFRVGLWYGERRIVDAVTRACEEARRACYAQSRVDFRPRLTTLRRSARRTRRELIRERPSWRYQVRRLGRFLEAVSKPPPSPLESMGCRRLAGF
jgi:hypothetical protein